MAQLIEPQRLVAKQTHLELRVGAAAAAAARGGGGRLLLLQLARHAARQLRRRRHGRQARLRLLSLSGRSSHQQSELFDGSKLQSGRHELGAELAVQYNRRWMMEPASTGSPLNI